MTAVIVPALPGIGDIKKPGWRREQNEKPKLPPPSSLLHPALRKLLFLEIEVLSYNKKVPGGRKRCPKRS